jgi:hypothetical protein
VGRACCSVKQFLPDLMRALSSHPDGEDVAHVDASSASASAWEREAAHPSAAASSPAGAWLGPGDTPFELRALGAALDSVCTRLELRTRALAPDVQSVVASLQADAARAALGRDVPLQLVRLNTELARLAADVADVREVLAALLEEDDDLDGMCLTSRAAGAAAGHAEVEILLEGHYRVVEEAASAVAALRDALRFTESYVRTSLDASRNALLRLDTMLTLGTLSLGAGGAVAATFGMNLTSGLEATPHAFAAACGAAGAASAAVFAGVWVGARHTLRAM